MYIITLLLSLMLVLSCFSIEYKQDYFIIIIIILGLFQIVTIYFNYSLF